MAPSEDSRANFHGSSGVDRAWRRRWQIAIPLLLFVLAHACSAGERTYRVAGDSMRPTFMPGDRVRVDEGVYDRQPPARGDLVAIGLRNRKAPMVKRVAAIGGDRVQVGDGFILVGEERYPIPRQGGKVLAIQIDRYGGQVPEGSFIALGDNPDASFDSASFGILSRSQLLGRVQPADAP